MSRVRSFVWVGLGGVAVGLVTIIPLLFAWGDFHDLLKPLRDSSVLDGVLDRNLLAYLFLAGVCCLAFLVVFFLVTAGICVVFRRGLAVMWVALLTCLLVLDGPAVVGAYRYWLGEGLSGWEAIAYAISKGRIVATSAEVLGGVLGVISGARVVRLVRRISGAKAADEGAVQDSAPE